ncbi:hypothetical protein AB0L41_36240 [Amycolatopsis mediterranei]|uniref:hypothetical protein n=1 Tax=Amycolatopsis mediterranei TaxID=33910 RepID=UPI003424A2A4
MFGYILSLGFKGIFGAFVALLTIGAAAYPLFGSDFVVWYLVSTVSAGIIFCTIYIIATRRELQKRARYTQALLQKYSSAIVERLNSFWKVRSIRKTVTIQANGDVHECTTIVASPVGQELTFYRMWVGTGPRQQQRYTARKQVKVQVRGPVINGARGISRDVTKTWLDDGRLEILVLFPAAIPPKQRFSLIFDVYWPGKCERLVKDKQPDEFTFTVSHYLERFDYTVILPKGKEFLYEPIGFKSPSPNIKLSPKFNKDEDQSRIRLRANRVKGVVCIGMLLQLK